MTDYQERPAVLHCHSCGDEIYETDECYCLDEFVYCEDCVRAARCEAWEVTA